MLNVQLGFTDADLGESTERLKAWAISKDERKADWNATHQNWIRRDAERRQRPRERESTSITRRAMERIIPNE